jgi:hypothetical protein
MYTAHDAVFLLGRAVGRDLFSWFQTLGTGVTREEVSDTIVQRVAGLS